MWISWEWDEDIRTGGLSVKLLRPLDPAHHHLATLLGAKALVSLVLLPAAALCAWLLPAVRYPVGPAGAAAAVVAVTAGFALNFAMSSAFGVLAFWSTQARHLYALWWGVGFFLSGWVAPLELFPAGLRRLALVLPFRGSLGLPVENLSGRLDVAGVAAGLAVTVAWTAVFLAAYRALWRRGLRRASGPTSGCSAPSGWRSSLATELEYRLNFLANVVLSLFWLVWTALTARVYYRYAGTIAGWTYDDVLVVMGLFFALNGVRQAVIEPNLARMSEYVRLGTLDHLPTKPVDSQLLVSLRHLGVYNWADPLLGLGLVGYALWRSGRTPGPGAVALFAVLAAAAMVLLYSISFALQTMTIWAVESRGMDDLVEGLLETGRFPVSFYGGAVRGLLTAVFPVAFMTTYPAEALLGRAGWDVRLLAVAVATGAFLAASAFWRFALRSYTGAGS